LKKSNEKIIKKNLAEEVYLTAIWFYRKDLFNPHAGECRKCKREKILMGELNLCVRCFYPIYFIEEK